MIKALIRFLFFTMPEFFLSGTSHILFDYMEIIGINCSFREIENKNEQLHKVLSDYLNRCYKQVNDDKMNGKEKKTDK